MYTANNDKEYLKLIDDALFELEEMISCIYDEVEEDVVDITPTCREISDYLKSIRAEVAEDRHNFTDGKDLEYMSLINRLKLMLPSYSLLVSINDIHHKGYVGSAR